ncbi:class IV adenylate cyclase [Cohaesibacter intestini]|uniref:class IV adenylate cyclase n=1 Tax=Cohaesibacter intestini TaxID=2211145 RepID=UPI000DE91191|nr:class IV adenylate cyclase [Cohaesibacter intestini]
MQPISSSLQTKGMLADPGDHFKGRFEVERKFQVDDLPSVLKRLELMAAIPFTIGNTETDTCLDFADNRLEANNQFQTLRHMQPSGRVLWISKGPAKDECIAMGLPDYDKALSMLKSLGFEEKWQIRKHRDIYFVGKFHVTLDRIDGLGSFVEIAIMTDDQSALPALRDDIQDAASQLDLLKFPEVHLSYRQLLHG